MSLHICAVSPQPLLLALPKKRCRLRFRPNFFPSKAVVLLLFIHVLMFLPLDCGAPCLVLGFCYALMNVLSCFASSCRGGVRMMP